MRVLHYFLLFSLLLFVSCSSLDDDFHIEKSVDYTKIIQVVSMENKSDRKLAYSLMNKQEKLTLWKQKLNTILKSKLLTKNQLNVILTIEKSLKPALFVKDSDELEYFKNVSVPHYLKLLKEEFAVEEIGSIFYSVKPLPDGKLIFFKDNDVKNKKKVLPRPNAPCNCNTNSMFSCRWLNPDSCKTSRCDDDFSGCGFIWAYECNGICNPFY